MRSNEGMVNRQGDGDLRFAQISVPQLALWLGWLHLTVPQVKRHRSVLSFPNLPRVGVHFTLGNTASVQLSMTIPRGQQRLLSGVLDSTSGKLRTL